MGPIFVAGSWIWRVGQVKWGGSSDPLETLHGSILQRGVGSPMWHWRVPELWLRLGRRDRLEGTLGPAGLERRGRLRHQGGGRPGDWQLSCLHVADSWEEGVQVRTQGGNSIDFINRHNFCLSFSLKNGLKVAVLMVFWDCLWIIWLF